MELLLASPLHVKPKELHQPELSDACLVAQESSRIAYAVVDAGDHRH